MSRVLENKANLHEINIQVKQIEQRLEDSFNELQSKVNNCALTKDFAYLSTSLETKANIDSVNESLEAKANKSSVLNALQRKANRSDVE